MTATQMEQKNNKGNGLIVFPAGNDNYMVESSQGKIFYKVFLNGSRTCTCADYVNNVQKDPDFLCKHILAAIGQVTSNNGNGKKPVLDERFIMEIEGREFVKYPGLLDLGHQKGIMKIDVDPIQYPTKENGMFAICKAIVVSPDGKVFTDVGDANPENCTSKVRKHVLRMASTRAIARALRSYTNIGMTCLEELGDSDEATNDDKQKGKPRREYNQQKAEGKVDEKNQDQKAAQVPEKHREAANNAGVHDRARSTKETAPANHQPKSPQEAHQADPEKNVKAKASEAQMTAIQRLKNIRSITDDQLQEMFQKQFGIPFTNITGDEAKVFIRSLQQAA